MYAEQQLCCEQKKKKKEAMHRTVVWWAGLCLYLSSLEIWLCGQHNIRSQDSLADWALGERTGCHCVCSLSALRFDFSFFFFGITRNSLCKASSPVQTWPQWNDIETEKRKWKVPTIFFHFSSFFYFGVLTIQNENFLLFFFFTSVGIYALGHSFVDLFSPSESRKPLVSQF